MVRSRCGISAVGGGGECRQVPFGLPSAQVLARRSFGTCFGREQVPCLLLDQRSHLTEPEVAAPALICGPAARDVRRVRSVAIVRGPAARDVRGVRLVVGCLWPGGVRRTPRTPNSWSLVARRREMYATHARPATVRGPAARDVRRTRPLNDRPRPGGTSRTGDRRSATPIPTSHQLMRLRTPRTWCAVTAVGAKCQLGLGAGCRAGE